MDDKELDRILNVPEPRVSVNRDGSCTPVNAMSDKLRELIAKWRCYVCGEPIGDSFILFSLNVETDRVFLAHKKCQARLDSEAILFGVQREEAALAESGALVNFSDVVAMLKKQWPWFTFSAAALAEYLSIESTQPAAAASGGQRITGNAIWEAFRDISEDDSVPGAGDEFWNAVAKRLAARTAPELRHDAPITPEMMREAVPNWIGLGWMWAEKAASKLNALLRSKSGGQ